MSCQLHHGAVLEPVSYLQAAQGCIMEEGVPVLPQHAPQPS